MTKQWSKYQLQVFDTYEHHDNYNIVIAATAGSGKTTVLVELSKIKKPYLRALFLAYNKSIAETLKRKVSNPTVNVSTIHSLGLKALRRKHQYIDVNKNKTFDIVKHTLETVFFDDIEPQNIYKTARKITSYIEVWRLNMCDTIEELFETLERNNIDLPTSKQTGYFDVCLACVNDLNANFKATKQKPFTVDFVDMIYLPVIDDSVHFDKYDEVFLDEAQDANKLMQSIVFQSLKPRGRFVVVGDTYQSIYGFMGADPQAFDNFIHRPNTKKLPLPMTYRCAKSIVKEAHQYFPEMEVFELNEEGEVDFNADTIKQAQPGDFVLCRNNAPLFDAYMQLTIKGKKCFIGDKSLEKSLIDLAQQTSGDYIEMIKYYATKRFNKAKELYDIGIEYYESHPSILKLDEYVLILCLLMEEHRGGSSRTIVSFLRDIFHDQGHDGIRLMSMHRSKGLEADRVFIIRRDLVPSQHATTPEMRTQENNLMFVAITRAKYELFYDNINFQSNKVEESNYYYRKYMLEFVLKINSSDLSQG